MLKRAKRNVWYAMVGLLFFIGMGVPVQASETGNAAAMTLQQTTKDAEIKEEPDQNANTLSELKKGTAIIVYGEAQDSWSQVEYDGVNGYMESSALESFNAGDDADELEEEFNTLEEDNRRMMDEYELEQKSKRSSIIWGVIIAVLVMAIFAVGIVSAVKKGKEEEKE